MKAASHLDRDSERKMSRGGKTLDAPSGTAAVLEKDSLLAFVSFDEDARVRQMNAAAARLLGVSRGGFLGMPFPAALAPDEVPKFFEHLHRCRAGAESRINTELNLRKSGGKKIPVELSSEAMLAGGQRHFPTAITDLRQMGTHVHLLLQAKDIAEQLFEFVSYPLVVLNEDLVIETANSAFRERLHSRSEELRGRGFPDLDFVRWNNDEFIRRLRRMAKHDAKMKEFVLEVSLALSGRKLALRTNAIRVRPRASTRSLILVTFEDITKRRQHESERERILAELQEMNARLEQRVRERTDELHAANEELKALSQRILQAQETERRFLARELHDEVGQALTGLNILLHRVADESGQGKVQAQVGDARKIVSDLMKRVRQLSLDLRPAVLDDLGLRAAVRSHIDVFSRRTGIAVDFSANGMADEKMRPDVKITAFRCVQEALTNVARHADVQAASVTMQGKGARLLLEVTDRGKGFDIDEQSKDRSSGLDGMRERVALCGGQLNLESAPGHGTRVLVQLPLEMGGKTR
jgi:PAS domain S-box-containing protein